VLTNLFAESVGFSVDDVLKLMIGALDSGGVCARAS
jgi:hypothetical protein